MTEKILDSKIDLKHFRLRLIKLRDDLMEAEKNNSDDAKTVELDQSRIGRLSRMDQMQSQQMALESQRRRKIQIRKIDAAWQRIENGEYGICSYCEDTIEIERLEFDPTSVLCSECITIENF
jgi:DnaK suppressor protein